MPRPLRSEIYSPSEVSILHCVQRCVRRAFLSGVDDYSGKDYSYRKEWIRQRIEKLASVFGIDVLTYAIMSNHLHVVLRNRPDVVETWSDKQIALRWLQIFPGKRIDEHLGDPTTNDVDSLARDEKRLKIVRERLSDISWFMRALSEPIARIANQDDECTGSFWEGRFKAQRITDEATLLACCMYVDLNPIRAAMAESPEKSKFTGAYDRIAANSGRKIDSSAATMMTISNGDAATMLKTMTPEELKQVRSHARKRKGPRVLRDAWLAPLTLDPLSIDAMPHKEGLRASNKGFLEMTQQEYVDLLIWTGKQKNGEKRGVIPRDYVPTLSRLGVAPEKWCKLVWGFHTIFGRSRCAGSPAHMMEMAKEQGLSYQPGQKRARECYA
jgi:REP element-mobilizing transposase RayT